LGKDGLLRIRRPSRDGADCPPGEDRLCALRGFVKRPRPDRSPKTCQVWACHRRTTFSKFTRPARGGYGCATHITRVDECGLVCGAVRAGSGLLIRQWGLVAAPAILPQQCHTIRHFAVGCEALFADLINLLNNSPTRTCRLPSTPYVFRRPLPL
jgi:hypothetical protein